jgi:peptide deformylase
MPKIIQYENPVLRLISKNINISDITKPKIQKLIKDMNNALDSQEDGAAIAAPQIGVSLRIFIISGNILDREPTEELSKNNRIEKYPNLVFINPKIIKISKSKKAMEEGCLSVRPFFGTVYRSTNVTIEAYNEKGEKFKMEATGILAQAFQHEIDHFEGVLFTDKASDLYEVLLN